MDARLIGWGRAVKRRRGGTLPVLWLFSDAVRAPDICAAVARLPRGLCGVVFRHDGVPGRAALGRRLAAVCRARGVVLVVAGDWRLAWGLRAGLHVRGGRGWRRWPFVVTGSAHSVVELVRARRAGVDLVFLSPAFATASHPGAPGLGAVRWSGMARRGGGAVAALGGVDGGAVRGLGRCAGVGAISALLGGCGF